jgi:excisionase family DNA binding protein
VSETDLQITRTTRYGELPEWLTVQETAAFLGVTTWFVYRNVHQGHIPHRRVGPKIIQIPKDYFDPAKAQQRTTDER